MNYLKIEDKDLPFVIDFGVIHRVCAKHGLKLTDIETSMNDTAVLITLLQQGLIKGSKKEGKNVEYSVEQAEEIFDHDGVLGQVLEIYAKSVVRMVKAEDAKKKD